MFYIFTLRMLTIAANRATVGRLVGLLSAKYACQATPVAMQVLARLPTACYSPAAASSLTVHLQGGEYSSSSFASHFPLR